MLLSAVPLGMVDTAYAAETSGVAAQSYYVAGGQCGDDLTWTLDSSGTLTISGTGPMYGYSLFKNPWCDSALRSSGISTRVKNVEISSGVTTLGAYALSACDSMTSVSLPETLLAVGEDCFFSSTALHNISIPNSVRSIGDCAFSGCNGLTRVTLGSGLKGIGSQAFNGCSSLSGIVIPEGVPAIEAFTFQDCSNLMEITIPRTVTSIGIYAFDGCYGLSKVTFTGTRSQWNAIDMDDGNDPLLSANITFAGSGPAAPTVTGGNDAQGRPTLKWNAVSGAAKYEVYRARSKNGEYIKYSTVTGTSYTNTSYIENGNTYYYKVRALDANGTAGAWSSIVAVTYRKPAAATVASGKCGDSASWKLDADGVLTITGAGPMADYGQHASDNCAPWRTYANDIKKVVVQKGVTAIGSYAFASLERVTSVTIPEGVTSIGSSAFENCGLMAYGGLGAVTLPEGLTTIGSSAFSGSYMDSLTLPESLRTIGGAAFEKSPLKTLTIPSGVTSIGNGAFSNSHLTSIQLPDGAQLGAMLFYQCYELTDVTLPADLTVIGDSMFENCTKLTHVTIPSGVTRIERETFAMCGALEEIRLPEGVESIGVIAFSGCVAMTGAYLPRSLTTIESGAFSACRSLTDVYYGGTAAEWAAISVLTATTRC